MQPVSILDRAAGPKRILALGAHADDIEIGCGGTILRLAAMNRDIEVTWVVFCASGVRSGEAQASAQAFLRGVDRCRVVVESNRDGFLPYTGAAVKETFERLKGECTPDLILTHYRDDRHQDHRLVSELTWNTWRDHLILEYEIPKYDGDLGAPNFFSVLPEPLLDRKIELVHEHFPSQRIKPWFDRDVFRGLARLRGMESGATGRFAEAFYCRKAVF